MGDSSDMSGGARFGEAASADDLRALGLTLGAGAPTPLASGVTFEPLCYSSTLVGNSEDDDATGAEESPAQLQVKYIGHGSKLVVLKTAFVPGATVHYYLKQTHTTAIRTRHALVVAGKRVRMNYVPRAGEHITLAPPRAPYLRLGGS